MQPILNIVKINSTGITRRTRGARRMLDNGQKLPLWMNYHHSLDSLSWFPMFLEQAKHMKSRGYDIIKKRNSIFNTCK